MVMVKDVCETQDDRIKKVLRNIQDVSENLEAQDRRIDDVMQVRISTVLCTTIAPYLQALTS